MKKNHLSNLAKTGCLLISSVALSLFASCARDGFDDEQWESKTQNTQLSSPDANDITITPSADGKTMTITWPVVSGAGGYIVNLYDTNNPETPIVTDSLVDGCSITVKREEDVNYVLKIQTAANATYSNTAAASATEKSFSTFTPTYMTIPSGSDLYEWFAANPLPADSIGTNINYDLEAGGQYTLSNMLDFGANTVTLRSTSKTNWATVTFTGETSSFEISAGLTLKYLNFDCSGSLSAFIAMSATPAIAGVPVTAWGTTYNFYVISDPIVVMNCKIDNLNSYFFWDNQVTCWFPATVTVDNCLVHLTTSPEAKISSAAYFWTNKGAGFVRNLTVSNSTFYNTGESSAKYFYQSGGFGISQTKESIGWTDNTLTYDHCTFYNVCPKGQWGNYNGLAGKSTSYWNMLDCIFYNCSSGATARRFLHGKQNQATATFQNNTYMKEDGTFETPTPYDNSGTQIEEDPQFKDPANGDFTISGPTQVARGTGDPRWLPSE